MTFRTPACLLVILLGSCAPRPLPVPAPRMPTFVGEVEPEAPVPDREVRATIVAGQPAAVPPRAVVVTPRTGDISLNFPGTDVRVVAQAVLGDQLRLPFVVAPGITAPVTLVTAAPVPRTALFALLEDALKAAGLAVTQEGGVFTVRPLAAAQGQGVLAAPGVAGFATETIALQFVSADEMKRLLDPIVPGVITRTDATSNTLIVAGTTGQRQSVRELLKQFDVNWLRNMSFALIVPQRTDSRLIVPEVEKLINGEGAPTRGLVRLIAMDRLNGILAITAQRQYLEDVRRWIEILDREGANNERRLFVYKVQNGRSKELAKTLNTAFGNAGGGGGGDSGPRDDFSLDGSARSGSAVGTTPRVGEPGYNPRDPVNAAVPAGPTGTATAAGPAAAPAGNGAPTAVISSDEANNAVIVFGTPRDFAVVEDALRRLDIPPMQVLIEAAITEVTLNDALRYGVQWNFQQGETNFALTEGPTSAPTRIFPGFSFFFDNGRSIAATLNALETRTQIKVLSAPKLMVLNNQTAALQVGDQVPVATQSAVGVVNPDSPIVNSIEYRDTGVILKVTPRVNAGGLVLLDIAQEVSDVATTSTSSINSPTISTRRIATSIAVQDGQTIALGGLIRDTNTKGKTGLPWLSRIPIIGGLLFGRVNDSEVRTELLVLLKPRVIRTVDDGTAITEELRARIRTVEPIRSGGSPP